MHIHRDAHMGHAHTHMFTHAHSDTYMHTHFHILIEIQSDLIIW
jgi:hypothetical protein